MTGNSLFDLAPVAMVILNKKGQFTQANQSALNLFGYTIDEILKLELQDLIHPDEVKTFARMLKEISEQHESFIEIQNRYKTKNGEFISAILKVVVNKDPDKIIGQLIDITEQIKTGIALKESEERYRLLVENSPFCIHSINLKGQITSMNPAGLKMLGGISEDNVCGIHYLDFVGEKDKNRIGEMLQKAFKGEVSFYDFDVDVEGEKVYFKSNFVPIMSPAGKVEKLMGVTQDATELKKSENIRIREALAREKNALLTEEIEERKKIELKLQKSIIEKEFLLKELHHRVKNNLQLVSSLLGLQANFMNNPDFYAAINDSQNRIKSMAMLHEILYQNDSLAEINVKQYLTKLLESKTQEALAPGKTIVFEITAPKIRFEITQMLPLGLMINEFVTNSIKHAFKDSKKGIINLELQETKPNEYMLNYKDNGPGIAKTSTRSKGLGMELIESFVEQLNGSIEMNSSSTGLVYQILFHRMHKKTKELN